MIPGCISSSEPLEPRRLLAALFGTVYDDPDLDGARSPDEPPVAGLTVFLDLNNNRFPDAGEPADVTDAAGAYALDSGAATGDLSVRLSLDPFFDPWGATAPAGGVRVVHVASPDEFHAGLDFHVSTRMAMTGRVFLDADGDGVRDAGEAGLSGWTVYIDDHDHVLEPAETRSVTDADGVFRFNEDTVLGAFGHRHYHLVIHRPPDWARTLPQFTDEQLVVGQPGRTLTNLDYGVRPHAAVTGRHAFYDASAFDGGPGAAPAQDDDAIAPDKNALLPGGGPATFANVTSYTKGINGVMVDLAGAWGAAAGALSADDFDVKSGRDGDPPAWAAAPAPLVTVRRGEGSNGSDRVTLTWPDGAAVKNAWLRVAVKANADTGLAADDVFYFGHLAGETGNDPSTFAVNALDLAALKRNLTTAAAPVTSPYDLNRDGHVNALDVAALKSNLAGTLPPVVVAIPSPGVAPLEVQRVWREDEAGA